MSRIFIVRPLFHPAAEDITVEGILHALSDPVRVLIFTKIVDAKCPQSCHMFTEISDRTLPKSTLSLHFKVLREAGLIRSERKGVEMHNTPRSDDICPRFGALIAAVLDAHAAQTERSQKIRKKKALAFARGA